MKELADANFKFDENGRKLSKQVENTVGKGEIARYEQFLLFPQCFQQACFSEASKGVIVWEWVKVYIWPVPSSIQGPYHREMQKVSTLVGLRSLCRLTTVETFRYRQIF